MTAWEQVKAAIEGAADLPVHGRVIASMAESTVTAYAIGGEPAVFVSLPPFEVDFQRSGRRWRIDRPGVGVLYMCNGERIWDFIRAVPQPTVAAASAIIFFGCGYQLVFTSTDIDARWGRDFPSGPVTESELLGRPTWVVPGTLVEGAAEIVVDQSTGVILAVRAVDLTWGAEFTDITFPDQIADDDFVWEGPSIEAQPMEFFSDEDTSMAWAVDDDAVEPPSGAPGPRVLSIRVESWAVDDDSTVRPSLGDTLELPLRFTEEISDPLSVMTLRARAAPPLGGSETPFERHPDQGPLWDLALKGDGWAASWTTARPRIGPVALRGELWHDPMAKAVGTVEEPVARGRVGWIRVRVRTEYRTEEGARAHWTPREGSERWIDVHTSPRLFDSPLFARTTADGTRDVPEALLVDIDLDAAEPLPLRPRHVPGDAAADGQYLWSADTALPLVARVEPDDPTSAVEWTLPLPVRERGPNLPRENIVLHPDRSGCWALSQGRLFRLDDPDSPAREHAMPASSRVVSDGHTLLLHGEKSLSLHPDGTSTPVDLPAKHRRSLLRPAGNGSGEFLALLCDPSSDTVPIGYHFRPARISADGEARTGPLIDLGTDAHGIGLVHGAFHVVSRDRLHVLDSDLRPATVHRFPRPVLAAGIEGARLWLFTHHPDGTGGYGWWPYDDTHRLSREDGRWLLAMLDLPTMTPAWVMGLDLNYPRVTTAADGTTWVSGNGIRGRRPDGTVTDLDISAALDAADGLRG